MFLSLIHIYHFRFGMESNAQSGNAQHRKIIRSVTHSNGLCNVYPVSYTHLIPTISEVVQKDSVVMYKGTRYRGYVYINPSKMKVIRTTYSDEGIGIDNVYYDNVIHILSLIHI